MNEFEYKLELETERAHHKATQEFLSEAITLLLMHTVPEWRFHPEECNRAREMRIASVSRLEDGGLHIVLHSDEDEDEDEEEIDLTRPLKRKLTVQLSQPTITALILITRHTDEPMNNVLERLIRDEGTRIAGSIHTELIDELQHEEELEREDYFTRELNKRLGFDVRDLKALMGWWKSYMGGMEETHDNG